MPLKKKLSAFAMASTGILLLSACTANVDGTVDGTENGVSSSLSTDVETDTGATLDTGTGDQLPMNEINHSMTGASMTY